LAFNQALYPQLTGYVLCNGLNGTPDMRGIAPRGTPAAAVVLATGGAATHTHGAGTYASAAHAHTVANHQHTVPDHSHSVPDHNHEVPAHCHSTVRHCHSTGVLATIACPVGGTSFVYYVDDPTGGCTVVVNDKAAFCTDTESGVSTGVESGVSTGGTAPGTDVVGPNAVAGTSAAGDSWPPWMNLNFIMRL